MRSWELTLLIVLCLLRKHLLMYLIGSCSGSMSDLKLCKLLLHSYLMLNLSSRLILLILLGMHKAGNTLWSNESLLSLLIHFICHAVLSSVLIWTSIDAEVWVGIMLHHLWIMMLLMIDNLFEFSWLNWKSGSCFLEIHLITLRVYSIETLRHGLLCLLIIGLLMLSSYTTMMSLLIQLIWAKVVKCLLAHWSLRLQVEHNYLWVNDWNWLRAAAINLVLGTLIAQTLMRKEEI